VSEQSTAAVAAPATDIEVLVAKARAMSPTKLAELRAVWAADEQEAARKREAAAAQALEAARQKVRDSVAALRVLDRDAINFTQSVLRESP
jgi:hypothetical protein